MKAPLHRHVNLPTEVPPKGYSDATLLSGNGRLLILGGHVAYDERRVLVSPGELVPQIAQTLKNLVATLREAGGGPEHLVKLTIHTKDVPAYRAQLGEIGRHWRDILGRQFPAMTLLGVADLFDEGALVEIDGYAWLPAGE